MPAAGARRAFAAAVVVAAAVVIVGGSAARVQRGAGLGVAAAAPVPALAVLGPPIECGALVRADVSRVTGTRVTVLTAARTRSPAGRPLCRVRGLIEPSVRFELRLPVATYRRRYLQNGCAGLCGFIDVGAQAAAGCAPVAEDTMAMASDDLGHLAASPESGVFGTDPALRADYAHRADHRLALTAKARIATYYGARPRRSYFDGCSEGGHEALTEAERYPADFDGILAGAPANRTTELFGLYQPYLATTGLTRAAARCSGPRSSRHCTPARSPPATPTMGHATA